jgi:hypothetical protein
MSKVGREEFDIAMEAVWTEIEYQNNLGCRRTNENEAKDIPGFLTLLRRYERKVEDAWADSTGSVKEAEEGMRKLAAICVWAMIYTDIWDRV